MKDVLFHIKEGKIVIEEDKEVLVMAHVKDRSDSNEATVTALLNAIKIDNSKVQLHYFDENIEQISRLANIVLIFGYNSTMLPNINLQLHKPLNLEGTILLSTYSLNALAEDKSKKQQLWKVLQNTFLK
jgi:DNA polymerase III psi subunit